MNLSQVQVDLQAEPQVDLKPKLRAEEGRILKIIEAIQVINRTQEWSTLKIEVFDSLPNILEKDLREEARKDNPDTQKLNRLSGQLKWAEKYSDLTKLENTYKVELQRIRLQLYGKTE
jgi:hypothetical protein